MDCYQSPSVISHGHLSLCNNIPVVSGYGYRVYELYSLPAWPGHVFTTCYDQWYPVCYADIFTLVELIWRTSCIRAIITHSDSLQVGALQIVTISGATLGSADSCTVPIPEEGVEEVSASIQPALIPYYFQTTNC